MVGVTALVRPDDNSELSPAPTLQSYAGACERANARRRAMIA
jgi:hypothetical protein